MELTDLRYFVNVATAQSFSVGARLSHVSPPAISKTIAKLEAELGTRLFTRTTRRVTLTPAGEILRARCREVLDRLEGLRSDLEEIRSVTAGELRIGAMEVFSIHLLPRALARVVREHPKVIPLSHEAHPREIERLLMEGRLDVGFAIGASGSRRIDYHAIGQSPGVLVCGRGHPLHRRPRLRANELTKYPFVAPRTLGLEHLPALDQFPEEKHPRTIGATIELLQMGLQLAIEGTYLGFFPEVCVRDHVEAGRLRVVTGVPFGVTFDLVGMTPAGTPPKRAARVLIDELRDVFGPVSRRARTRGPEAGSPARRGVGSS
jgi:DNA-binding transcriptional LysR family regulator